MKVNHRSLLRLALLAGTLVGGNTAVAQDLGRAVPSSAHLVVQALRNPERDFQREYLKDVWRTLQEENIGQRALKIVTSRMPESDLARAEETWTQVTRALEPASVETVLNAEELIYAQVLEMPFNHHLLILETTQEEAARLEQAAANLFELFRQWSNAEIRSIRHDEGELHALVLDLPDNVPFRPALCRIDNVVILSTHESIARQSAAMLDGHGPDSKFDDPRFIEALTHLPDAEDSIVFFDGRLMFDRLKGLADVLRDQKPDANQDLARFSSIYERILDECAILDYEITVEYTDGLQNRTAVLGRLADDAQEKMLYQAVAQGKPFEDWETWIPVDATSYSLSTGVNLHVIYQWLIDFISAEFPESHAALAKWRALQDEIEFDLARDLLKLFTGESIAVTAPITGVDGNAATGSVWALRCSDPERIGQLIQRAVARLAEMPALEPQQIQLVDSQEVEGFHELEAAALPMVAVRPMFGFHDGWMICSGSPQAVAKVLETRRGSAASITDSAKYQKFGNTSSEPVWAVSYSDLGASVEQAAETIEQIAAVAPMIVGMASANVQDQDLTPLAEALGLLPSVAKIVREFDFLEDQLSVTRAGPWEESYRRDAVVNLRAPQEP